MEQYLSDLKQLALFFVLEYIFVRLTFYIWSVVLNAKFKCYVLGELLLGTLFELVKVRLWCPDNFTARTQKPQHGNGG